MISTRDLPTSIDTAGKIRQHLQSAANGLGSFEAPVLEQVKGIRGAPIRHPFMAAAVWYLSRKPKQGHLRILEIGSYMGSSLLTWAFAANKFADGDASIYAIDPLESCLDGEDYSAGQIGNVNEIEEGVKFDFAYQVLRHNMQFLNVDGSCLHLRAFSSDALPILRDEYFDLIYVDGNHGYRGVRSDLLEAKRLLKEGGLLCGDDLELQGDQCDVDHARANSHVDFIADPKTKASFHPGVTLAVWEVLGRVSSWAGFWAAEKQADEWARVSLKDAPIEIPPHFPPELQAQLDGQMNEMRRIADSPCP